MTRTPELKYRFVTAIWCSGTFQVDLVVDVPRNVIPADAQ